MQLLNPVVCWLYSKSSSNRWKTLRCSYVFSHTGDIQTQGFQVHYIPQQWVLSSDLDYLRYRRCGSRSRVTWNHHSSWSWRNKRCGSRGLVIHVHIWCMLMNCHQRIAQYITCLISWGMIVDQHRNNYIYFIISLKNSQYIITIIAIVD